MRVVYVALVLLLTFASLGAVMAQMDQNMDQNQTGQDQAMDQAQAQDQNQMQANQSGFNATVQSGPVLRAGLAPSADVFVNGRLAMRVPASAAGMTPIARAQMIADRLNQLFAAGVDWNDTRVAQIGREWTVNLDGRMIATADARSARVLGTSPGQLASSWAQQTVVALGGTPSMIASQLQPYPTQVAGAQQQVGAQPGTMGAGPAAASMNWMVSPTKTVPLLNASTGNDLGSVMIGGSQNQLDMVNAVAVYQYTAPSGAQVWTFVPVTTTTVSGQLTRVPAVGVVGAPSSVVPSTGLATGNDFIATMGPNSGQWSGMIRSNLAQNGVQTQGNTKIVPLYSADMGQVVGAAQVIGASSSVQRTQAVIARSSDGMLSFMASSTSCTPMVGSPTTLNDVLVSSIILMPAEAAMTQPGTSGAGPGMAPTAPPEGTAPEMAPAPGTDNSTAAPDTGTGNDGMTAPDTGTDGSTTTTPDSGTGAGTETTPPSTGQDGTGTTTP